jgi:hypothetical protein
MLHVRHERELAEGIEREKAKNRAMTAEQLERTVIEMMREINVEIKRLSTLVIEARRIADVNSQLMKLSKQRHMERECDGHITKINNNDAKTRRLVEELKLQDQKLSKSGTDALPKEVDEQPVPDNWRMSPSSTRSRVRGRRPTGRVCCSASSSPRSTCFAMRL